MIIRRLAGEVRSLHALEVPLPAGSRLFSDRRAHICLLAGMALLILFSKLHQGDLAGYDSAVYAYEGRQMLQTGEWGTVYLNGRPDFDKPPLFVWMEAVSMALFGATDFAARFPAALLGWGTLLLVALLARELSDSYWLPVWAMLVLLTTHAFMRFGMHAMTDMPFSFFFVLAIFCAVRAERDRRWMLGCGLAVCAAIMTRSFLGLIPLGVVVGHLATSGRLALLRSKEALLGLALALGLPAAWFLSQYRIFGEDFLARHFSFTYDNLPLTNGKRPERFAAGLLEYPRLLLTTYWPWLPLMVLGLATQLRKRLWDREAAAGLLPLWVAGVLLPFSFAEFKWLRYILPAFPAFAILAAIPLDAWLGPRRRERTLLAAYALLLLAMAGMGLNPKYRDRPEELRRLAPLAAAATPAGEKVLLQTDRNPRDAHLFQLIWYANRECELVEGPSELLARLQQRPTAVIADKAGFEALLRRNPAARPGIRVLGETEHFICWTGAAPALQATAPQGGPNDKL